MSSNYAEADVSPFYQESYHKPKMPESYSDAYVDTLLKDNTDFPQMLTGHIVTAGAETVRAVYNRDITWNQFRKAKPTASQFLRIKMKLRDIHTAFKIPWMPELAGIKPPDNGKKIHMIPDHDIQYALDQSRNHIVNIATKYADWAIPDEEPSNPKLLRLFNNTEYHNQALALVLLWEAAAKSLDTEEIKSISRQLKNSFVSLHDEANPKRPEDIRPLWTQILTDLRRIARLNILKNIEAISVALGKEMPIEIINAFIDDAIRKVNRQYGEISQSQV